MTRASISTELDLNLPEEAKLRKGLPPLLSLEELMRRNQELREWFPQSVPTEAERWAAKTAEEFRL